MIVSKNAGRNKTIRRDDAQPQHAVERRGFLAATLAVLGLAPRPKPARLVAGWLKMSGNNVKVVIVPPGCEVPAADPGRARFIIDMEDGFRLVYLSQGPTAEHRARMEDFYRRNWKPGIPQLDWAEAERELFGPDCVASA